jgi:hypothetical protein
MAGVPSSLVGYFQGFEIHDGRSNRFLNPVTRFTLLCLPTTMAAESHISDW